MTMPRRPLQGLSIIVVLSMMFSGLFLRPAAAQGEDGVKRQHNPQTGRVSFLGPASGLVLPAAKALGGPTSAHPADPALALAKHFGSEFGLKNPGRDLAARRTNRSANGHTTVHYQQNYQGIPVLGGELIVNTNDNGDLYSISGEISTDLTLSSQPTLDPEQARQTALAEAAQWYGRTPEDFAASAPELWIYDESLLQPSTRPAELVWRLEVTSRNAALPVRELVLVNAVRGSISLHFNQVDTAWTFPDELQQAKSTVQSHANDPCLSPRLQPPDSPCAVTAYQIAAAQSLSVLSGSHQFTQVSTAFASPLSVLVTDSLGNPVGGMTVTFTAPDTGASVIFAATGTYTSTAVTGANGVATSPALSANKTGGGYFILATVEGAGTPAGFVLGNATIALNPKVQTYTTKNSTTLPGTLLCDQTKPACTGGSDAQADAAHKYALGTYYLYAVEHNRSSIDNAGMTIVSNVHYDSGYANASWGDSQMFYGDVYGFALADDVVAHELTHGITEHESNLFYYYQSGAINESFSDLWGEYYDQSNGLGNDSAAVQWLIGEDIAGLGTLRSMSDPPAYNDPDRMSSTNYYPGSDDNGGVHTNSGVNNKAISLMVAGGNFNNITVTALGWDKTAALYYEANTNLLSSGADYSDLYYALQQACSNLIGQNGITAGDCGQVRNAADAVEMNGQPVPNFNTDVPDCDQGNTPVMVFSDSLEAGTGSWTFSNGAYTRWQLDSPYGSFAHSGDHFLYADDYPSRVTDASARLAAIAIPNNAYLRFAHAYDFQAGANYTNYYDGGVLEYTTDGGATWLDAGALIDFNGYKGTLYTGNGNPLQGRSAFVGGSHGYISTRLNLLPLAGKSVSFRWRMGLDSATYEWGWWLDDIKLYRCPLDRVAPAAIGDLSAAAGATTGTVTLSWTAVGDDASLGTAAGYLVRYSTSKINDETTWNAAAPVTAGIPAPARAGTAQAMTVSGLTPGGTYYFAMRAQDEEPNLSGLSNSASAAAQTIIPVPPGTYDDTDLNWIYSGAWTNYTGTGPYNNTSHYASTTGSEAQFSFNGNKFTFTYVKASNRGLIDVYVDGTKVTQINAYASATTWQQTWTSPTLTSGVHTLRFVYAGAGTYIDVDTIQIFNTPPVVTAGTFDDTDIAWAFSSGWAAYTGTGPYNGTSYYTGTTGNDAQVTFIGTKFTFTYVKASNRGSIDVYVDGTKVDTIVAKSTTTVWQQTWTSPSFAAGQHTARFVHAGPSGTYIDVDAIQIFALSDIVAPAAIGDLAASTGPTTGTVTLKWTAPGDDGTTGTASGYLVRYSAAEIKDEAAWNAATPVTTGIPAPQAALQPESMTVSGLAPGATYYFAVRAQDEEPNLARLSNSPSVPAQSYIPVSAGIYDDTDINWIYSGTWATYTGTGPYNSTSHYASTIGSEAQFSFIGNKFIFTYVKAGNRGSIDVFVDGVKIDTLVAKSTTTVWQQTWTSPSFAAGQHMVRFVHADSGTYIDIDAIQIFDTPLAVTPGTYDDNNNAWVFSSNWTAYTGTGPVNDTDHYTSVAGSEAQITFTGTGLTLTYVKSSSRSLIDIYVDGVKIAQINAKSTTTAWQQTWTSPSFTAGQHTVRFVHAGTAGTYIDIDAITILP